METCLHAERLFLPSGSYPNPCLTVDADGILTARSTSDPPRALDGSALTPAFFDIHTHGARGEDVMSATPEGFHLLGRFLAAHGVAYYLPTTVTAGIETTLHALERMAGAIERGPQPGEAQPIGIHLEGPFLSHAKRGVHPSEHLQPPSTSLFDRFQEAAHGHICLLTLAPELPGATDLIRYATAKGTRISLGHTDATAMKTLTAIDAGATGATHTFNAMRALDHREPGVVGVVLDDDRLYAELICDGVHVAPAAVRLWLKAKGVARAILVTDAMAATGQAEGEYTLGGLPVTVTGGRALLSAPLQLGKEVLAGSLLTMDRAVAHLQRITGVSLATSVRMASSTPAAFLGRPELTSLEVGTPANLNRFDRDGHLVATYLRGMEVPRPF